MTKPTARERLAEAAFALFDERGYEQTTIDDITERAGLGRTTFFRHYRSKEDVIFPDHDLLLEQVARAAAHLEPGHRPDRGLGCGPPGAAALRRTRATSPAAGTRSPAGCPALRDREIASVARYQRLFREFIAGWMGDPAEPAPRCGPS